MSKKALLPPLVLCLFCAAVSPSTHAQSSEIKSGVSTAVPNLVRFSGDVLDARGDALTGAVGITFALYAHEKGGQSLWRETQTVVADKNGHYAAALGLTSPEGIPTELFTSGEAQWLGVQVDGQPEDHRILLLSVPYALKAKDSETLGGLPASAFVRADKAQTTPAATTTDLATTIPPNLTPTGGGTTGSVALWTSSSNLGNSSLFQAGSGSTARIGVNTLTPATTLDVAGPATLRGAVNLTPISPANSAVGAYSQQLNLTASAFNSSTHAAVNQTFQWKAEPTGNNSTTPAGTLNLLFGSGTTAPAETGLKIAKNGLITFATGQSFPGAGTITSVTAGSALTGGGTTGPITLNLDITKVPLLAAHNTFTQPITFAPGQTFPGAGTITAVTAGTGLTGGGTTAGVKLNVDSTKVPFLAAANTFTQPQTINAGAGSLTVTSSSTAVAGTGYVGVFGATTVAGGSSDGVLGQSNNATAVRGDDIGGGSGVVGTSATGYGVYGSSGFGTAVYGVGASQSGISINPSAVVGDSTLYNGVTGMSNSGFGVVAVNKRGGYGISAANQGGGIGIYAAAATVDKDFGVAIRGENFGTQVSKFGGPDGIQGITHSALGSGTVGINDAYGGIGVYGISTNNGFGFETPSHVSQGRGAGGWVKAMIFVDPFVAGGIAITRCFNSQATGATVYTAPCGFTITHNGEGANTIDLAFQVNDRFISATSPYSDEALGACQANCDVSVTANQVFVHTDSILLGHAFDYPFTLIIY